MKTIVTNCSVAPLRDNPSCRYGKIIQQAPKLTLLDVLEDWHSVNTAGGSVNTYLPVKLGADILYVDAQHIEVADVVTIPTDNTVRLNGRSTLVLNQSTRPAGQWQKEIKSHGCGACCARIGLNLAGKSLKPEDVMDKAKQLFGKELTGESYGLSAQGIATICIDYGVRAEALPVTKATLPERKRDLDAALRDGRTVCCWVNGAPFSSNHHWVIAVGYTAEGKIVIGNSGGKNRIQYTTLNELTSRLHTTTPKNALKAEAWLTGADSSAGMVIIG